MSVDINGLGREELYQLNDRVVEQINMLQTLQAHVDMMSFNLGAWVSFQAETGRVVGALIKRNRKTVNLAGDDGRQYRVSPGLLSAVKHLGSASSSPCASKYNKKLLR